MRRRRRATSRRRCVARGVWPRCARWRATASAVSALLASLTRVRGCWPGPVRMRSLWALRRGRLSGRWPCCPHSMRTRVATAARPEGRVVWCPGCARGGCVVVERGGAGPLPVLSRCACVLACYLRYCASLPGRRLHVCACRALVAGVVGEVVFARCVCGTVRALVPCVFSPPLRAPTGPRGRTPRASGGGA